MSYEASTDLDAPAAAGRPDSWFGRLVDGLNAIGSVLIGVVMLMICADVARRNLLNHPIDGVTEMVSVSIIMIVFLQLPSTLRHGRMSRADLFIDPFLQRRPTAGRWLRGFYSLLGVFACGVIAYASWPGLMSAWGSDEFFGVQSVFTFPVWPMRAVVILGAALAMVQYVLLVIEDWRAAAKGQVQ